MTRCLGSIIPLCQTSNNLVIFIIIIITMNIFFSPHCSDHYKFFSLPGFHIQDPTRHQKTPSISLQLLLTLVFLNFSFPPFLSLSGTWRDSWFLATFDTSIYNSVIICLSCGYKKLVNNSLQVRLSVQVFIHTDLQGLRV